MPKAFEVVPRESKSSRTVVAHTKDGKAKLDKNDNLVFIEEEFTGGYDVHFPRGHSVFIRTDKELNRLGFDKPARMFTDEEIETGESLE